MPSLPARAAALAFTSTLAACSGDAPTTSAGSTSGGESDGATSTSDASTSTSGTTSASTSASTASTSTSSSSTTSTSATTSTGESTGVDPTTTDSTTSDATSDPSTDATTDATTDTTTGDPTGGPFDDLLTIEHAEVKGTHNSYHIEPAIPFDKSHEYTHLPLAEQAELLGVRAYELDVHRGVNGFEVYHIAVIDPQSTCATFVGCITAIAAWSKAHPLHLPIVIWIEVKDSTGGLPIGASDLDDLDDDIRSVFADDHLYTPDDLEAGYASPRARLDAEGWPTLAEHRGRVLFVLLNVDDAHASDYTGGYVTTAGRAMFARAEPGQFALPWAAIAKLGIDDDAAITAAHAGHLLIATNVCGAGESDASCNAAALAAQAAGIHMLKDDFPGPVDGKDYFLELEGGSPARCNPITAPAECTSAALEAL